MQFKSFVLLLALLLSAKSEGYEQDKVVDKTTHAEFSKTITNPATLKTCTVSEVGYLKQWIGRNWWNPVPPDDDKGNWILGGTAIYPCEGIEKFIIFKTAHKWLVIYDWVLVKLLGSWTNPDKTPFVTPSEMEWVKKLTYSMDRTYSIGTIAKLHYSTDEILTLYVKDEKKFQQHVPRTEFFRIYDIFKKSAFVKE